MAINIVSSYTNPQPALMQKYHNIAHKEVEHKVALPKPHTPPKEVVDLRDISSADIREYLTTDEKRVLKEVFGDLNVDKNTPQKYSYTRYTDFLKGSQIDVRL